MIQNINVKSFEDLRHLYFTYCRSNCSSATSSVLATALEIDSFLSQFLFCIYLWPRYFLTLQSVNRYTQYGDIDLGL